MSDPTRILIAEDQGMMRSALASLLNLEEDMSVVATVARGDEVVATVLRERPDVVLLDIELPGRSGLDVIGEVIGALPGCVVIVVTTFGRPGYLKRALESGAKGFLVKDDPVEELAAAIRRVLAGEIAVNPRLAAQALGASPNPLSDRERQVLNASSGGATIADIAAGLHLSASTVRNYLSSAIGKTNARNRGEALSLARDRGWL
ncbi:response regulator transcription factor [Micromonospora sp. NBC_01796]|uniref:response regulator transcription factor n=1 Tax=Micromonospora sp. NBC_01796 TaxID=2975987 RepID=UPI002DDBF5C9|nr:response regulator transcription factor [Micromonospora sp. NBC_01796]WSA84338.1 response regulator transcription factor [Micromonospora sp. NBC_01796]